MTGAHDYLLTALVTLAVTGLVVLVHYEGLRLLARITAGRTLRRHRSALLAIMAALLALHVLEIVCYGLAYWWMQVLPDAGFVRGQPKMSLFDGIYLSAMAYSTASFGELSPLGALRVTVGMEAIAGLMMIAWSASFTYMAMTTLWPERQRP